MSKTALLVIDVQDSFLQRDYWTDTEFKLYATHLGRWRPQTPSEYRHQNHQRLV